MQKPQKTSIDEIDRSILSALQHNGKLSNVQLAQKVGLSESACLRRVRMLEESGIIDRYVLLVDQATVGIPGNVFVRVTLEGQQQEKLEAFERNVANISEVMECYLMSGDADYILRVICRNNDDYKNVHSRLTSLPGVRRINSSFALRTVIKKTELPIRITD
ncbi:Lrp/AsnC family transcriptional regulator [Desulfopila inferna]|uniref:Lrp/AsnC family transcriptional regulator n=1 Tax=Desulfopila inferna TaxID=468528 RepID=UPI001963EE5D|nr:Lrp/AsnC family transcriptional regulator [Desulfopila inferna]MBM9606620.1 Lrp/AsnC family transcriptional regulator [Desulfopila inferna]